MQFFTPPSLPSGFPSLKPGPLPASRLPGLPDVSSQVDEIGSLLPTQLGSVVFPAKQFSERGSQSLVVHMFPNLNNARVENTGFNPRRWTIVGCLTNNIFPAKNENWSPGTLYPYVWDKLKALLQTTTSQILIHPEVGEVNIKVEDYDYTLQSEKPRDGVIVTMHFIECINDNVTLKQTNASFNSPLAQLSGIASTLDQLIADPFNDPRLAPPGISLQGLFTQIAGYIRNCTNFPNQAITSLNAQVLGLTSTIGGAAGNILNAPANIYSTINSIISLNKRNQLGFAPIVNAVQNDRSIFTPQTTYATTANNSFNGVNNPTASPPGSSSQVISAYQRPIVYPVSETGALIQAYFALTITANKGPTPIVSKSLLFSQRLAAYYVALRNYQTAQIQQALLSFANQLVALQNPMNSNGNLKSFVNSVPFTWMDASNQCGDNIDTIMLLNSTLSKLIIIPANSTIYYNA